MGGKASTPNSWCCVWEAGKQGHGIGSLGLWAAPAPDLQGLLRSKNAEPFWFLIKSDQEFQGGHSKALKPSSGALSSGTCCAQALVAEGHRRPPTPRVLPSHVFLPRAARSTTGSRTEDTCLCLSRIFPVTDATCEF